MKTQTDYNKDYRKKAGIISKSFTLNKALCDDFKATCDAAGVGQAATISAFMKDFIAKHPVK